MTAAEMKTLFLNLYDAATSLGAPGWEDDEISSFLSKAQLDIIEAYYNNKDLKTIADVVETQMVALSGTAYHDISNSEFVDISDATLSTKLLYLVDAYLNLTRTNPDISTVSQIPVEFIDIKDAPKFYLTPINKVWFRYPKAFVEYSTSARHLVILVDAYTTVDTDCYIVYVRKPADIDITGTVDSELGVSLHKDIVVKAVEEAVKSTRIAKITNQ